MKCALELEDSRAYWAQAAGDARPTPQEAFDAYWFGARSLARVEVLLVNLRVRYDAFPPALAVLRRWPEMSPETRACLCHWHLQLADPLYRKFTGSALVTRRAGPRAEVTRDWVVGWMGEHGLPQWTLASRIKFASNLLSSAYTAGLVATNRDPRPVVLPRVPNDALEYLLYLLRGVSFEGSLLENPYLASVGLEGGTLEDRLRGLPGLAFKRQQDVLDFGWRFADLGEWADARFPAALSDRGAS